MVTIVGISGSLRKHSFNAGLLRAAAKAVPEGVTLAIESIKGIPLYNGDVEEAEGIPPVVNDLKERIVAADGLLMVTPENNNSIPGVFKNAIDWLSRPPEDRKRIFGAIFQ
jgi:NAD(P)H-dependent FMN reductase